MDIKTLEKILWYASEECRYCKDLGNGTIVCERTHKPCGHMIKSGDCTWITEEDEHE